MHGINKKLRRRFRTASLGEWAVMTYGALLLVQIVLVFILLVLFAWNPPAGFGD